MNNITLITASYNTPSVTEKMILSFKMFHENVPILVSENSDDSNTTDILKKREIPFIIHDNKKHSPSVDVLFKSIKTKYALLVDTDVIFLRSIDVVYNEFKEASIIALGDIGTDSGGMYKPRIHPCFMMVDVETVLNSDIKYHDVKRTDTKFPEHGIANYDVGSSFFEDLRERKMRVADFKGYGYYYNHYGAMSWGVQKYNPDLNCDQNIETGEHNFYDVYVNELRKKEVYEKETSFLCTD